MNDLIDQLEELRKAAPDRITAASDLSDLQRAESELIGKRSPVAAMRRTLGTLDDDSRPRVGSAINDVTSDIAGQIARRRAELERLAEDELLRADRVDVTLERVTDPVGMQHILTTTIDEVVDIFTALGYRVADGPEVETAYYNFDALNTPPDHPARAESDTLYVDYGEPADEMLLRTQTSPMQARYMETHDPPVYVVVPGRVFRSDTLDPTHSPVFHQVEGLAVDEHITFADLKGTLAHFAREFFGPGLRSKLIPHFFPFTEPSAEMHVSCFACDGSGCRVCSNTGWIELVGCGMVDPNVLEAVGYDPQTLTGFAFGIGVERLALVRHGINHIRHFFDNDVRVLRQFT